jgi:hypothetical protein
VIEWIRHIQADFSSNDGAPIMSMHAISDNADFQQSLAALPLATYRAGETVLSAASTTGRLLILKQCAAPVG